MKYAPYILNITILLPVIVFYSYDVMPVRDAYALICVQIVLVGVLMLRIIQIMGK